MPNYTMRYGGRQAYGTRSQRYTPTDITRSAMTRYSAPVASVQAAAQNPQPAPSYTGGLSSGMRQEMGWESGDIQPGAPGYVAHSQYSTPEMETRGATEIAKALTMKSLVPGMDMVPGLENIQAPAAVVPTAQLAQMGVPTQDLPGIFGALSIANLINPMTMVGAFGTALGESARNATARETQATGLAGFRSMGMPEEMAQAAALQAKQYAMAEDTGQLRGLRTMFTGVQPSQEAIDKAAAWGTEGLAYLSPAQIEQNAFMGNMRSQIENAQEQYNKELANINAQRSTLSNSIGEDYAKDYMNKWTQDAFQRLQAAKQGIISDAVAVREANKQVGISPELEAQAYSMDNVSGMSPAMTQATQGLSSGLSNSINQSLGAALSGGWGAEAGAYGAGGYGGGGYGGYGASGANGQGGPGGMGGGW